VEVDYADTLLPVEVLEVDYAGTVADLEGVARRLVAWCDLAWEPACLAFHEGKRPVRTASVSQVRQPIYTRSVARWKNYERSLGSLLAKLSGERSDDSGSSSGGTDRRAALQSWNCPPAG
jgi:hypothetical protein